MTAVTTSQAVVLILHLSSISDLELKNRGERGQWLGSVRDLGNFGPRYRLSPENCGTNSRECGQQVSARLGDKLRGSSVNLCSIVLPKGPSDFLEVQM